MPGPVKNFDGVWDSTYAYRKTLAAQPDNSVVISSIGMTTNLRDLV